MASFTIGVENELPEELDRRRKLVALAARLRTTAPSSEGPYLSAEDMVREDRER